jgi:putative two-component system response regulator
MHDIGKIGVQDQVLLKPGELTAEEWQIMKSHTSMGAKILANSRSPYLQMGAEIALNHHERWDGSGYPNGERGETIPLSARIMNIGDIYDALRSRRPYKPALDHDVAVDIITHGDRRTRPQHFDPAVLSAFAQHPQTFRDIFETYTAKIEPDREAAMACENPIPSGKRIFQDDRVEPVGAGGDDRQRATGEFFDGAQIGACRSR